jgi:hypothetical protein
MKKSTLWALVIVVIVIIGIVWYGRGSSNKAPVTENPTNLTNASTTVTAPVSVTETTKVSSKTSKYENAELGFAVNYPTAWEADNTNSGVTFIIPIDSTQVSTVAKLQADVNVTSGKCAFPPVTTVKDRAIIKIGDSSVNTISMSNTVQGRAYFNRMYSLQKANICYMFTFSSIALSPESKGMTGSNITQAQNNNKAIVNTTDADFSTMVKSFVFVQGAAGQDETKIAPVK